jgi:hypothetical protein
LTILKPAGRLIHTHVPAPGLTIDEKEFDWIVCRWIKSEADGKTYLDSIDTSEFPAGTILICDECKFAARTTGYGGLALDAVALTRRERKRLGLPR